MAGSQTIRNIHLHQSGKRDGRSLRESPNMMESGDYVYLCRDIGSAVTDTLSTLSLESESTRFNDAKHVNKKENFDAFPRYDGVLGRQIMRNEVPVERRLGGSGPLDYIPWKPIYDTGSSGWGRSIASSLSWSDEFEQETTQKVQTLLDQMEGMLYEEHPYDVPEQMTEECQQWKSRFPHFRIVGSSILPRRRAESHTLSSSDEECEENVRKHRCSIPYSARVQSPSLTADGTTNAIHDDDDDVCASSASSSSDDDDEDSDIKEEMIASHGHYDENACTSRDLQLTQSSNGNVARRISGSSSNEFQDYLRRSVLDQLLGYVWSEVVVQLKPVLNLYSDHVIQETSQYYSLSRGASRQGGHSRLHSISSSLTDLDGLLQVSPKTLQTRTKSFTRDDHSVKLKQRRGSVDSGDSLSSLGSQQAVKIPHSLSSQATDHLLAPKPTNQTKSPQKKGSGDRRSLGQLEAKRVVKEDRSGFRTSKSAHQSAPSSPPNWSRHVTLPPIETIDWSNRQDRPISPLYRSISAMPKTNKSSLTSRPNTSFKNKSSTLNSSLFDVQGMGLSQRLVQDRSSSNYVLRERWGTENFSPQPFLSWVLTQIPGMLDRQPNEKENEESGPPGSREETKHRKLKLHFKHK